MRLGLIGDLHAEDDRLAATLVALEQQRVDLVLCTGDVVDGYGNVDRTCALLEAKRVLCVRGNHDRWIRDDAMRDLPQAHRMTALAPESLAFLKGLPATRTIDVEGGVLVLCHGVGADDMRELEPDARGHALSGNAELLRLLLDRNVRYMVGGHTHVPMVRELPRGDGAPPLVIVNPGTLFREDAPGYFVLDTKENRVEMFALAERLTVMPGARALL
jgi:predicted phosphodiesterase